jgi:acetyl/propionyl-CoA carboxylase alpha subunit
LIAKVIATGASREQAIERMQSALESAKIEGVPTTVPLHRQILAHEDFRAARCDTLWLGRERDARRL